MRPTLAFGRGISFTGEGKNRNGGKRKDFI